MLVDVRLAQLLLYIVEHQAVKPVELAHEFDVSIRTVRNHVHAINRHLDGVASINLVRGRGYAVAVADDCAFTAELARVKAQCCNGLPQTPEARVGYLINDLLFRTDYITIDDLAGILHVSRSSISADLKRVEARLGQFDLAIDRRSHHGIRVVGAEIDKRLCLASAAMENLRSALPGDAALTAEADEYRRLIDSVSSCIDEVALDEHLVVDASAQRNLCVHILIALLRIRENCYVPLAVEQLSEFRTSHIFPIARRIADLVGERTGGGNAAR